MGSGARFIDTREYGRLMDMPLRKVQHLIRAGKIPATRVSPKRYVIPVSALDELEERARAEAQARAQSGRER